MSHPARAEGLVNIYTTLNTLSKIRGYCTRIIPGSLSLTGLCHLIFVLTGYRRESVPQKSTVYSRYHQFQRKIHIFENNVTPPPLQKKNLPKIRELTDFNEIFSVDLLINECYNAPFLKFFKLSLFFRSVNPTPYLWGAIFLLCL